MIHLYYCTVHLVPLHITRLLSGVVYPSQAAWFLKARALTEQTYIDEVEMAEEGIAELLMDQTAIADLASEHACVIELSHTSRSQEGVWLYMKQLYVYDSNANRVVASVVPEHWYV